MCRLLESYDNISFHNKDRVFIALMKLGCANTLRGTYTRLPNRR